MLSVRKKMTSLKNILKKNLLLGENLEDDNAKNLPVAKVIRVTARKSLKIT